MKKQLFVLIASLAVLSVFSSGCSQVQDLMQSSLTILPGNTGGSGTVDPTFGSHSYKSHERVIVTATPQPGSLFAGWLGIDGILSEKSAVDPSKPVSYLDNKINIRYI